jgi:hypothetical protein
MKKILSFFTLLLLGGQVQAQSPLWQSQANFEIQRLRGLNFLSIPVKDTFGGVGFSNKDSVGAIQLSFDGKVYVKRPVGWSALAYSSGISVGLSAPSVFSVSGSPVNGTGTLGLSFATGQTANQVLATPNGVAGALGLRSLVPADMPTLSTYALRNQADAAQAANFWIQGVGRLDGGMSINMGNFPAYPLQVGPLTPGDIAAQFTGRVVGVPALASNELVTLSQLSGFGSGTVTSVGLTAPSVFTVSGSPVTTSGTLAVAWATGQVANQVLASPDGTTGAVALRSLGANDIPALSAAKITSGTLPVARGGTNLAALGTALQQLRVNAGGTALEYFTPSVAATPTLDAVTTAGNTTPNTVNVGGLGASGPAYLSGGLHLSIRTTASSGAISVSDYTVLINNTSDVVMTLPSAASAPSSVFVIKKISANSNTVTITPAGAETIDANSTLVFSTQWRGVMIQSNGTTWYITGLGPI